MIDSAIESRLIDVCRLVYRRAFHRCSLDQRISFIKQLNADITQVLPTRKDLEFISKVNV